MRVRLRSWRARRTADGAESSRWSRTGKLGLTHGLGVRPDSIRFGAPDADGAPGNEREQMMAMVMSRMSPGATSKAKTAAASSEVKIGCSLRADWELKGKTHGDLWLESQQLRERLVALKLAAPASAGDKGKQATEEEKEQEEERAMGMAAGGMPSQPGAPGDVTLVFVAHPSSQQLQESCVAAMERARKRAEALAAAAGAKLGPLVTLSAAGDAKGDGPYDAYREAMSMYGGRSADAGPPVPGEVLGAKPDGLRHRATLTATWQKLP